MLIQNNTRAHMQTSNQSGTNSLCNRSEVKLLLQFAARRGRSVAKRLCKWYSMRLSLHRPVSDVGMEALLNRLWELAMQQAANDALANWEPPKHAGEEDAMEQITYPEVDSDMVDGAMCAIVDQSIARRWMGFYPLRSKAMGNVTYGNRPAPQHRMITADDTDEQRIRLIASLTR